MKTLPHPNVCQHPDGVLVRIKRGDVLFQAFVPNSHPAPLVKALLLRDQFKALAGAASKHRGPQQPRSNTGVSGVSETTMWRHDRPYPCFIVDWSRNGKRTNKRFVYGSNGVARSVALQTAIAYRQQKAGNPVAAVCDRRPDGAHRDAATTDGAHRDAATTEVAL